MKRILLASANPHTLELCSRVLSKGKYPDIQLVSCNRFKSNDKLLEVILGSQVEVVIARGERKKYIESHLPEITTVSLSTTAYDLLRALHHARKYGSRAALVATRYALRGSTILSNLLEMDLIPCNLDASEPLQKQIDSAINQKIDVLVGGFSILSTITLPKDIPVVYIGVDTESILASINEARRIYAARFQVKHSQKYFSTLLTHINNGVIAVDENSLIRSINPAAQHLLQISESQALGQNLDTICPPFSLSDVLSSGSGEQDALISYQDKSFVCDKIAVQSDGALLGGLALFQDVHRLQKSEASVRRKIADRGLTAEKHFDDILGNSPEIKKAISSAKSYAITNYTILLLGESGTGKELFAQSIHNYSKRRTGPFVAINCAAMPANLLESELFGYEAGAFTGAKEKGKPGMIELAHGGTLFLDEIGELDLLLQGKLLRALQERKITRVGGEHVIPVNLRIIAATNRNLYESIALGTFRRDLFYRLNVLRLTLPPLKNCSSDIPIMAQALLKKSAGAMNLEVEFTPDALSSLQHYDWPGNVRELLNFIERMVALYGSKKFINGKMVRTTLNEEQELMLQSRFSQSVKSETDLSEIHRILSITKGNYTQAAKILGLSRVTLWRKLKQ